MIIKMREGERRGEERRGEERRGEKGRGEERREEERRGEKGRGEEGMFHYFLQHNSSSTKVHSTVLSIPVLYSLMLSLILYCYLQFSPIIFNSLLLSLSLYCYLQSSTIIFNSPRQFSTVIHLLPKSSIVTLL